MTVSTETNHNEYTGNDVTTSFPYTFRIFKKSDLVVFTSANDGEDIKILRVDTDYTVTSVGGFRGGNVVLKAPLAAGVQISISRELPATQETSLRNQGKFFPEVHEDAFDKLTMLIQQVRSSFSLALRKPSFLANYYDAVGNYIRNLRDPSRPQDAATMGWVDRQYSVPTSEAKQAAVEAKQARDESQWIANKFGDVNGAIAAAESFSHDSYRSSQNAKESEKSAEIAVKTVIAMNAGQEFFLTESELLASFPTEKRHAAKALDTKKVWFWQSTQSQDVDVPVTYIDGASANTNPSDLNAVSPGSGRAHIKIDVSQFSSITITDAKNISDWIWVFRDADLNAVLFSAFSGNGIFAIPAGAVWAYRTVKVESLGLIENPDMKISAKIVSEYAGEWIDTGMSELSLANKYTDNQFDGYLIKDTISLDVIPIEGAAVVTTGEDTSLVLAPGDGRAYIKIDVERLKALRVTGARSDIPQWKWVLRDETLGFISYLFSGDGMAFIPPGAKWAYRTVKIDSLGLIENPDMQVLGINELTYDISDNSKRINALEADVNGDLGFDYKITPIEGAAANTNPGDQNSISAGVGRAYIRLDVSGVESISVTGAVTNVSAWVWVFRDANLAAVEFTNKFGNVTISVPNGAVWAYRTVKVESLGLIENAGMSVHGVRRKSAISQKVDAINGRVDSLSVIISQLDFDMSPDGSRISPNDFEGATQHERINNARDFIKKRGWGVLELGVDTIANTSTWIINSALLLPNHCWLYLNKCKLKLANGVFDNIIRNDGIVPNANPFLYATELNENQNIRIFGSGITDASMEGPDIPYSAPHPINGGASVPWVGDWYGWRTIGILLANVKNYKVHDFAMRKTTCWAISQEHGCDGFEVFNIDFNTTVKNGDGVDVRQGCKNGRIYGITGTTLDDTVALSALKNFINTHPSGNYIYPLQVGGYGDRGFGSDIENVRIWNIKANGSHNGVRLLNSGGSKLIDVSVDDAADSGGSYGGSIVLVSSGYGTASQMGDTVGISINRVKSNFSKTPVTLSGPIQDSQVNGIYQARADGVLINNTATLQNTPVTNVKRV